MKQWLDVCVFLFTSQVIVQSCLEDLPAERLLMWSI